MYTSQGASENYCASMDIDMSTEQTWQNWINLEACTPEVDGSSVFGNEYQQPVNGLNYDYPEFIPGAQYAADVCTTPAMEYPISWASSISVCKFLNPTYTAIEIAFLDVPRVHGLVTRLLVIIHLNFSVVFTERVSIYTKP
ncbi:hypothetical protein C0995_008210 [Termitomyces sp. Mi166|nr:hypothetical protein C0995_008210 [Termitomyces sp. Mi166\